MNMRSVLGVAIFASSFLVSIATARDRIARRYRFDTEQTTSLLPDTVIPTSTAAATAPTLAFNLIDTMTACQAASITWSYQGDASTLTLVVTNEDVPQSPGVGRRDLRPRQSYTVSLLSTDADPTVQNFTWPEVTVPQGYYVVEASVESLSSQSAPFSVMNGTDLSCLVSSNPSPSSLASTAAPTSSASSSTLGASASGTPALDTSNTSRHVNSGAVAGGVVGGLAVAVAVIAVFLFFRYRRPSSRRARPRVWSSLASTDAPANVPGKKSRKSGLGPAFGGVDEDPFRSNPASRPQSRADSVGQLNLNPLDGTDTSNEDATSISHSEKSIVTPTSGGEMSASSAGTLESATPLPHLRDNRRSSASFKHADNANYSRPRMHSSGNSTNDHWVMNNPFADGGASEEGEMIAMHRSASGGESMRRTPRKPVPAYDPFEPPPAPTIYNEQGSGNTVDDSSSDHHSHRFNSKVSLAGQQSVAMQGSLKHQGSFGEMDPNRPVHYLIPDMPPPSRD